MSPRRKEAPEDGALWRVVWRGACGSARGQVVEGGGRRRGRRVQAPRRRRRRRRVGVLRGVRGGRGRVPSRGQHGSGGQVVWSQVAGRTPGPGGASGGRNRPAPGPPGWPSLHPSRSFALNQSLPFKLSINLSPPSARDFSASQMELNGLRPSSGGGLGSARGPARRGCRGG